MLGKAGLPDQKAVEIMGVDGEPIQVTVMQYGSHNSEQLDA
jgi:hypothetical protein